MPSVENVGEKLVLGSQKLAVVGVREDGVAWFIVSQLVSELVDGDMEGMVEEEDLSKQLDRYIFEVADNVLNVADSDGYTSVNETGVVGSFFPSHGRLSLGGHGDRRSKVLEAVHGVERGFMATREEAV